MKRFPGKTLEELDDIDWFRLQRAVEAERLEHLDHRRDLQVSGVVKQLDTDEWEDIRDLDRAADRLDDGNH